MYAEFASWYKSLERILTVPNVNSNNTTGIDINYYFFVCCLFLQQN